MVQGDLLNPPPSVVLPQEHGLVVNEFTALGVDDFPPEMLVLQEIQEVQTRGIFDEAGILWLLPVQQVL